MCKKFVMMGVLGAVAAVGLVGTGAWSYVKTGYHAASEVVSESVPIEWELKRARQMIKEIKPEISKNLQIVAREEIGVAKLAKDIEAKELLLAKGKDDILRLKNDLESGSVRFVYAGRTYSEDAVRTDLENRFKRFKVLEATTGSLNGVLDARQKNLDAAHRKVEEMLAAKRELEVQVENLQARMTMVEVAQTSNPVSVDDSHLSRTRDLLDEIRTRIDVAEQVSTNEGILEGSIPLDETSSPNLLNEIADHFDSGLAETEAMFASDSL